MLKEAFANKWNAGARYHAFEKSKQGLWIMVRTVLILGICFVIVYPILSRISVAIMSSEDLYDASVVFIPRNVTMENFLAVTGFLDYYKAMLNTAWLSASTSVLQAIACALAGYSFARLPFRGRSFLFAIVIFTIVIPPQTIMVPTYLHYRFFDVFGIYGLLTGSKGFNLLGSYGPFFISSMLAMGIKNGLYIFLFRQFFRGLPKELEEVAYVDGAGVFKCLFRIILPNAVPVIATVLLFSFVWQWNDSYFVNLFMPNANVLSVKLNMLPSFVRPEFVGGFAQSSMYVNTAVLMAITPIFILYLFVQRYFVESVERSGLVG